jgi:peptidyl-prolyl cis-trans isomerase C
MRKMIRLDRRVKTCQLVFVSLFAGLALTVETFTSLPRAYSQGLEGPPAPEVPSAGVAPLPTVEDPAGTVVARVNGRPIFQSEVERGVTGISQGQKIDPAQLTLAQAAILQKIIDRNVIREYLTAQKMMGNQQEVDVTVEQLRANLQRQNSSLEDLLARTHQTEASLRKDYAYELGWKKYVAHNATDETMEALFKQFHEQFDGTQRRISHILLRPDGMTDQAKVKELLEQAKKLREEITSGSMTFEDAAQKLSAGPSHIHGGDLGYIPINGEMAESFSKAAFSLKPGEISQPVSTAFGIHLIKVTDIKPGTKTWQDSRDALQQAMSPFLLNQLLKSQLEKATIEFAAHVPHFKKGTAELESNEFAPNLQ